MAFVWIVGEIKKLFFTVVWSPDVFGGFINEIMIGLFLAITGGVFAV